MTEVKNAIIHNASLTHEPGLLSARIELDYGDVFQSFGGFTLYLPKSFENHSLISTTDPAKKPGIGLLTTTLAINAGHFIYRVMEIAEVDEWKDLTGKTIRVRGNCCGVEAIGHIVKDEWFCPKEEFRLLD